MKKIHFAALVAIIAVGSAISTNAENIYVENSSDFYVCFDFTTPTCFENLPPGRIYLDAGRTIEISLVNIEDYHFHSVN